MCGGYNMDLYNHDTVDVTEKNFFTQVKVSTIRNLYKLFEPDFEMFGYGDEEGVEKYLKWGIKD